MASGSWSISSELPPGWLDHLDRLDGGFFHTGSGLLATAAVGEPFFAQFQNGSDVTALAAGVRSPCRLDTTPSHVYVPTLPAIRDLDDRHVTLDALVRTLEAEGAAVITLDSFDAPWRLTRPQVTPVETTLRREYVVRLGPTDTLWGRLSPGHRRHIRRGDREGWELRVTAGAEAQKLLAEVERLAADRAASRGEGINWGRAPFAGEGRDPAAAFSGSATFAAFSGKTPLAVALIGWAARRAFYVMGGSTAEGYRAAASLWLHWRIMCRLAEARFTRYNLGGTPATAESPQDPAHGLYRFKSGFSPTIVACASARWVLSPTHQRLHRLGSWLGSAFVL